MKRLLVRAAVAAALVGLLAACTTTVTPSRLQFTMSPTGNLGYEVSSSGEITVTARNLVFRNSAGQVGVTLTGLLIEFYDEADAAAPVGDNANVISLNVFVPPGIQCLEPDPVIGCTMQSEEWRFAPGPQVTTVEAYQLLPIGVVIEHISAGQPVGWHADLTFTGFTAIGQSFTSDTYRVSIAPPN
jgi:hypothetical protein